MVAITLLVVTNETNEQALATARAEAEAWDDGERSVILTGSHARGDGHPEADLDIRIVGDGPDSKVRKRREPFLVSVSASSEEQNRDAFTDPARCAEMVPGWRSALIFVDPNGIAASLKKEAESWTWERVDAAELDGWVAEQVTALAEEIHTLIGDLDQDLPVAAAATVAGIATDLAPAMAVRHRVLYASEKELWDLVAEAVGNGWSDLQARALGDRLASSSDAAMKLFARAAEEVRPTLDERQSAVVEHAVGLVRERVGKSS